MKPPGVCIMFGKHHCRLYTCACIIHAHVRAEGHWAHYFYPTADTYAQRLCARIILEHMLRGLQSANNLLLGFAHRMPMSMLKTVQCANLICRRICLKYRSRIIISIKKKIVLWFLQHNFLWKKREHAKRLILFLVIQIISRTAKLFINQSDLLQKGSKQNIQLFH